MVSGTQRCSTFGFDHGAGHPLLFLCNAKAPNYRKNKAFNDLAHSSEWPNVAGAVIKARKNMTPPKEFSCCGQFVKYHSKFDKIGLPPKKSTLRHSCHELYAGSTGVTCHDLRRKKVLEMLVQVLKGKVESVPVTERDTPHSTGLRGDTLSLLPYA